MKMKTIMGLSLTFIYLMNCVFKRFALINTGKYPIDLRKILQYLRKNKILDFFKTTENPPLFKDIFAASEIRITSLTLQ